MKQSRLRLLLALSSLALILAGLRQPSVTAQSGPVAAAVNVRRIGSLALAVVTGDFNGDGILDLAATSSATGRIVIELGRGDGTFKAPVPAPASGRALAAADFNNDGKLDLIADDSDDTDMPLKILLGHGDGTFAPPVQIGGATIVKLTFAVTADFDGDGSLDLAVGIVDEEQSEDSVLVYQGHGDGTFTDGAARLMTGTASAPVGASVADLNGDGRPDIVVANHDAKSVSVFLNQGSFSFAASDRLIGRNVNDVAIADLNGDGKPDLVLAVSLSTDQDVTFQQGWVYVFLGNGDGTFGGARNYDTAVGTWRVVIGDFNRDGVLDIASASRSADGTTTCGPRYKTWDAVDILSGVGDGTFVGGRFGGGAEFSIGNQHNVDDPRYRHAVSSLAVADLNGDHFPDLIVSDGVIFQNHAPDTNWAPTVRTGGDVTLTLGQSIAFSALADDVDQDVLTYSWHDSGGQPIQPVPSPCLFTPRAAGVYSMTVTVSDGHGHQASDSFTYTVNGPTPPTVSIVEPSAGEAIAAGQPYIIRWSAADGSTPISRFDLSYSADNGASSHPIIECQDVVGNSRACDWQRPPATEQAFVTVSAVTADGGYADATSGRFSIRTGVGAPLGYGWSHADIANVGAAGSATHDGFVYNGQGITVQGSGADIWGTADAFHFVWQHMSGDFSIDTRVDSLTNTNAWTKAGLMIRANAGDASSVHASIFVSPSKGLVYQRRVDEGGTSQSTAGPAIAAPVWLRLTRQGSLITALYRKNATDAWTVLGRQTIAAFDTPALDVGLAVTSHADGALATGKFVGVYLGPIIDFALSSNGDGVGGLAAFDGTTYTFHASGSDIWGTSDNFIFASALMEDNEQITLRVRSVANTDPWAKAGVMIRETFLAGSKYTDAIVSPGKGVAMQYRDASNGASASPVQISGTAPIWLRIRRSEPASPGAIGGFTTWYSKDFTSWRLLGSVDFNTTHQARIGIALASHKAGVETTVVIDDVRIER